MTADLHALLRVADPAHGIAAYDEQRIVSEMAQARSAAGALATASPRPAYRRRMAVRAAVAATVAGVVLVVPVLTLRGGSASPAAADVLRRAAAITAYDATAAPGQYWAIRTTSSNLSIVGAEGKGDAEWQEQAAYLVAVDRTDYVAADGLRPTWSTQSARRVVAQLAGPAGLGRPTSAPEAWTTDVAPAQIPSSWQAPSPQFLAAVPRDVGALRARLYDDTDGHGRSHDGEVLVHVADVLRSGLVPADLRHSLFRVLETVPGVEVTASAVSVGGVTGVAIGRLEDVDGSRQEIVIDPRTGQVLAEREVATRELDGIPAGTVIGQTTVERELVDHVPAQVRAAARHDRCEVAADGAVTCTS